MPKNTTIGFLLTAAAAAAGCDDPIIARPDVVDVVDVQDADVPGDMPDVPMGMCGDTRFVRPLADSVLGVADDLDRNCANGFTTNIEVATNAPMGTLLELRINGRVVGTQTAQGALVMFSSVMFDTGGMQTLEIYQGGLMMACATANVSVNCNTPRCQITAPMRSALNAADNATPGSPFSISFVVSTDIEEGREVSLNLSTGTQVLRAPVMGGMATFRNLPLTPDGTFRARATCTNRAGNTGTSAESTFTVDSVAPMLTLSRPMMGETIGVSGDSNAMTPGVQFRVCGRSDSMGEDLCATVGGAAATCAPVASITADTCVELTCPSGSAPFNIDVTARDAAGNTTRSSVMNVRCQSSLPSVRVVAPLAYDAMNPATILSAARDADPMTPGFQADVIACTDRSAGMASLFLNGDMMALGAPVAVSPTVMGDPCAAIGMGFVSIVRFPRVTLPQTFPSPSRPMEAPTANPTIQVGVTDGGDTGRSAATQLYIDSLPPVTNLLTCGRVLTPGTDGSATSDVDVTSDVYPVTLTLSRMGSMPTTLTLAAPSLPGGRGRFLNVRFLAGVTNLTATSTDPAGNTVTTTSMCSIEVGNPPTLSFTMPTAGQVFSASRTTNITLRSDAPVGTLVTITIGTMMASAPVAVGGTVTFSGVMLPEGDAVAVSAVTTEVPGRGIARATVTVVVDTQAPTAPSGLTALVPTTPASARRAGTVRLSFSNGSDPAPAGGTRAVARYEIRTSSAPITLTNFAMATASSAAVSPGVPGAANSVDLGTLRLETGHYFAIRSVDVSGNVSPTIAAAGPVTIALIRDTVVDMPVSLGNETSGGFDVNGDGFADVVTGTGLTAGGYGGLARIYFGSATGISATRYTEIRGPGGNRFGLSVASLGDVNGDGIGDIIVGEPGPSSSSALVAGQAFIFFGRRTWNAPTTPYSGGDADVAITGGTGEFERAALGSSVARCGDFNGDGLNDVAFGALQANTGRGAAFVVFGRMTWPRTIAPSAADVIIRNTSTEALFGRAVVGGGRVVGNDMREDLLVGYGAAGAGGLAVFAGRSTTGPVSLTLADAVLNRPGEVTTPATSGQSTSGGVGDINGDGRSDIAIGASGATPGRVALYFGNASGTLDPGPVITTPSININDTFGSRIASIYDPRLTRPSLLVHGGTTADLLAGAAGYNGSDPRVYMFTGRASWTGLSVLEATHAVALGGLSTQPITGVNWVGDVDGDGFVDAAVGRASGNGTLIVLR